MPLARRVVHTQTRIDNEALAVRRSDKAAAAPAAVTASPTLASELGMPSQAIMAETILGFDRGED